MKTPTEETTLTAIKEFRRLLDIMEEFIRDSEKEKLSESQLSPISFNVGVKTRFDL